jgi:hypothetical protein
VDFDLRVIFSNTMVIGIIIVKKIKKFVVLKFYVIIKIKKELIEIDRNRNKPKIK